MFAAIPETHDNLESKRCSGCICSCEPLVELKLVGWCMQNDMPAADQPRIDIDLTAERFNRGVCSCEACKKSPGRHLRQFQTPRALLTVAVTLSRSRHFQPRTRKMLPVEHCLDYVCFCAPTEGQQRAKTLLNAEHCFNCVIPASRVEERKALLRTHTLSNAERCFNCVCSCEPLRGAPGKAQAGGGVVLPSTSPGEAQGEDR